MEEALDIVQTWCTVRGLSVNPNKTTAIMFIRKYKPEPVTLLKLWVQEIEYKNTVKYLGVQLDTKLSWKTHLEDKRRKLHISIWMCKRALGKSWDLKPRVALCLYKAVLLPRLLFAAIV